MTGWLRSRRLLLWFRYTAGSIVAGVISQAVFVVCYALGSLPAVASITAFVAGAVPNYLLNRRWAWRNSGRADVVRETLPYAVIVVATALAAAAVTSVADAWVRTSVDDRGWQIALVAAAFLATYGAMFVLKFVLFDRLVFAGSGRRQSEPGQSELATREDS
jgi:putative flippase GtrA